MQDGADITKVLQASVSIDYLMKLGTISLDDALLCNDISKEEYLTFKEQYPEGVTISKVIQDKIDKR